MRISKLIFTAIGYVLLLCLSETLGVTDRLFRRSYNEARCLNLFE
jgi:hypothetical protein